MRIYCHKCTEHALNTSDKFVCGGPYNGAMFGPVNDYHYGSFFPFEEYVKGHDLYCPRCTASLTEAGALLTEHGVIAEGQATVDESNVYVNDDGSLMYRDKKSDPAPWAKETFSETYVSQRGIITTGPIPEGIKPDQPIKINVTTTPLDDGKVQCEQCDYRCKPAAMKRHVTMKHAKG